MKIKTEYNFKLLQKRLLVISLLTAFIFLLIFGKLSVVQIFNGPWLQVKATQAWARSLPLKAKRGNIYDRNGAVLASSISRYDIYTKAVNISEPERAARVLATNLDLDYNNTLEKVKSRKTSEVLIKMQVDDTIAKKIIDEKIKGIYLTENLERHYNFGDLLTQILGYCTIDSTGQTGIEAYYDKYLKGTNGKNLMQTDASGKEIAGNINYYLPAISGMNLTLTIDLAIQIYLENVLEKIMVEQKAKGALAMIMDAKTGEIVASSNKPSFNLNLPPREDLELLNTLSKNKAVTDVYEPGSTFKLLTTAAALDEGLTNLDDRFYDPGYRMVDGQKIKCWKTIGHGSQNLVEGVCNSCNCVFMDLGLRLGKTKLYEYLRGFGIGSKTGIDFMGETSGLMMPEANVKTVDLARISFGQAIAVSALQLVTSVTSVINDGKLFKPQILKEISMPVESGGESTFKTYPILQNKTISKKTSADIRFMMKEAVNKANAINAFVPGYTLGGKTGTAQKYENGHIAQGKYVSSFIGFAPYEDPQYVLLLLVDEPGAGAYYGSVVAAPYAKDIYSEIFKIKNIPARNLEEDLKKMELNITVPNLVGLGVGEAIKILKKLELQVEIVGDGDRVISQLPPAGLLMFKNGIVIINT